ncbi:hypothetical protein BGZ83_009369 [Gryganskiella cystojenkinii]|nr:hypothetical protein BGZ83_009369 [Gryganskiella cystojenkinii]
MIVDGTCHATSMEACPISLGCDPKHSHLEGCFPLPVCKNLKDTFKLSALLIPKHSFKGDPNQAHWTSDFHHIAPYAKIDTRHNKLLLRTRRDLVKTQSGGGFGATVSSTRWSKFGTFSAKFKAGSSGKGIVTAFLLSNPAMGEEISFEITGQDPKKIITNYYRRVPLGDSEHGDNHHQEDNHHHHQDYHHNPHLQRSHLVSHEQSTEIKKDTTAHELVYKIDWTEAQIRWSVDGKVIRTIHAKDTHGEGLPINAMQLQLTIWDAGYAAETKSWAGGETDYGEDNMNEYIMTVDSVEFSCQDSKEGNKPWPGPDAMKRLKKAQQEEAARAKRYMRNSQNLKHGPDGSVFSTTKGFFEIAILSLIKWSCVLLALVCGAAYFTEPKSASRVASTSSSRQNLGLRS